MATTKSRSPRTQDVKLGIAGTIGLAGSIGLDQIPLAAPGSIYTDAAGVMHTAFELGATAGGVTMAAAGGLYYWHGSRAYRRRTTFHGEGWAHYHDYRDHLSANSIMNSKIKNGHKGMGAITRPDLLDRAACKGYRRRPTDYGMHLGKIVTGENARVRGKNAWNGFERGVLMIGPPGTGKTAKVIPWVIDAPGAVLAATTKTDIYEHTALIRAARGPVWLFNPQELGKIPSTLQWDPVVGCEHYKVATARARALVHGTKAITAMQEASWGEKCVEILSKYLMAARLAGGDLTTVAYWLANVKNEEPLTVLRNPDYAAFVPPGWANSLEAEMRSSADRMKGSIWSLAQSAVAFMSDPVVAKACSKGSGSNFDVKEFIRQRGTLYLIGSDADDMIAPLLSALTNYIYDTATEMAAESKHRRLSPPFTMILDEVAKITPVDLPGWGATARSAGIWLVAAVQTFAQLRARWGDNGADTIETVFSTLMVLAGIKNDSDLTKLSNLVGMRDDDAETIGESTHENGTSHSSSTTTREKRIMPQSQIRMLPPQYALVITSGAPAFVVKYEKGQIRANKMVTRIKAGKEPEKGYNDYNPYVTTALDYTPLEYAA